MNINDIFIAGDCNLDLCKQVSKNKIENLCQQFNLANLVVEHTHFTETSSSCIDLMLTSHQQSVLISGVGEPFLQQDIRYHCPVFCVFDFNRVISKSFTRHIWLYDKGNYNDLREEITNTNWQHIKNQDLDIYTSNVTNHIINTAKKHIPNKNIIIRHSDPEWLTSNIKKMMRKRKRLYDKYQKAKNEANLSAYKIFRNKVTAAIRRSKKTATDKLAKRLSDSTLKPKDYWKTLKQFIKPHQSTSLPPLVNNDTVLEDDTDKANILNDYFAQQTTLDETNASLPATPLYDVNTLNSIVTTADEIQSILKSLPVGKAAGPDSISNRLLNELAVPLSEPLAELFNSSLRSGKVPKAWKEANITPVHKKDDPSIVSNYRPISLLNTLGKVLEKIVHKHVFNFCRDNNIITTFQSGFVPGDCTVNQLSDLYNTFCKALDEGKEVRTIFCDISKAFDRVWHRGLLFKLRRAGITGSLLSWFSNYLQDRQQRVVLPGATSDWSIVRAGVPQGSILGPLLFIIYINDIVDNIKSSIRLFADDTSLYIIVDDPLTAGITLNSDLYKIQRWASEWLVAFNPAKSESLLISRKINKPYHPPLFMNYQQIQEVTSHKHLGLYFSNDCSWHEHINYIKSKAWQRINIMRRLKFQLDRKSLQTIYFSFIRPILEYADIVWNNCSQNDANELEKIQNEAARIVTGATRLASIHSLLTETGWETLSARRNKHKLVMFYKMRNNLCPDYLSSLVPSNVGSTVQYNLRNVSDIRTINTNTQLYYNSFLPSAIREWNELPRDLQESQTITSFKYRLNSNITRPPPYYLTGNRLYQIHHTRLRLNCSALNQHLFSKNIIPSPLCACGEIEDSRHFLLICNRYQHIRVALINSVSVICEPTLNV
ncbi:MAG: reverse transcriptase family protein, partial [Candidatus Thiodiazotropha taylori]|nr:reverse transcriptase family protein [Candidatus Thiodiazotropha taylori]MCW4309912.1 reverse transcriptase family protein [Candidatus Thiodiazotropha endolucinida]